MMGYRVLWVLLFIGALFLGRNGAHELAILLFPLPVAKRWILGEHGQSLGLVVCAVMAALFSAFSLDAVALYGGVALLGVVAGIAVNLVVTRGYSYAWCVAVFSLAAFALLAAVNILVWDQFRQAWSELSNQMVAGLRERSGEGTAALNAQMEDLVTWYDKNLPYLHWGMLFGNVFMGAILGAALLFQRLRLRGEGQKLKGSFREMRPPDWLVWLAIAAALLIFADSKWPMPAVRVLSWNGALALAIVYGLNGFSILLYGLVALRMPPLLAFVLVLILFFSAAQSIFFVAGFFDTWWELRAKFDGLRAWRERREGGGGNGSP